ncbi:MAG: GlcG/HbpS family heme-binding protein [Lachnospirales bacterium]
MNEKNIIDEVLNKLKTEKLTLNYATEIIDRGIKKARELNENVTITVVDNSGNIISMQRMDNSILASIDVSYAKAYTAISLESSTEELAKKTQFGEAWYGLQYSYPNKFCMLSGGVPIVKNNTYVGAIGVSGGVLENDIKIATYALSCF